MFYLHSRLLLLDPGFEMFVKAEKAHGIWIQYYLEGSSTQVVMNLSKKIIKQYLEALKILSSSLSKQVAQYDVYSMITGTMIILEVWTDFFKIYYLLVLKATQLSTSLRGLCCPS